mgnify:CR=1 FL=1
MGGEKGRSNNGANNNETKLATLKQQNDKLLEQNKELQEKLKQNIFAMIAARKRPRRRRQ